MSVLGPNVTTIPGLRIPVSTRLTGAAPIPPISCTSCEGRCSGLSQGLLGLLIISGASRRMERAYQSRLVGLSNILSPSKPYCRAHWRHVVCLISAANHLLPTKNESKPVQAMVFPWRYQLHNHQWWGQSHGVTKQSQLWPTRKRKWSPLTGIAYLQDESVWEIRISNHFTIDCQV